MAELKDSIKQGYHNTLRLEKKWNDQKAEYDYQFKRYGSLNGVSETVIAQGDEAWAKRMSEHYGLKIIGATPELEKESRDEH